MVLQVILFNCLKFAFYYLGIDLNQLYKFSIVARQHPTSLYGEIFKNFAFTSLKCWIFQNLSIVVCCMFFYLVYPLKRKWYIIVGNTVVVYSIFQIHIFDFLNLFFLNILPRRIFGTRIDYFLLVNSLCFGATVILFTIILRKRLSRR